MAKRIQKAEQTNKETYSYVIKTEQPQTPAKEKASTAQELLNRQQAELNRLNINLSIDQMRATNTESWARADYNHALSFQVRANTILNGMQEIRLALNSPQIDDENEKNNADPSKVKFKSIFEEEKEKNQLKKRYAQLMDLFYRVSLENELKSPQNENKKVSDNKTPRSDQDPTKEI